MNAENLLVPRETLSTELDRLFFDEFVLKGTSRCDLQPFYLNGAFVGGCDYVPAKEAAATNTHGCYEYANDMWKEQPKWMDEAIITQAARRIGEHAAAHNLRYVRLIGHGGELLMASAEWLDNFSTILRREVKQASPGTEPYFFASTNGLNLTKEKAAVLAKHGYAVSLSCDGDEIANDRHRRDRQGHSIHNRIMAVVPILKEAGVSWSFQAVVDPKNDVSSVLNFLASYQPGAIGLMLPHANHSVQPEADPREYGRWMVEALDWYLAQPKKTFVQIPNFDSLLRVLLGGSSTREAVAGRHSQELFVLPNGFFQRVDTIKSTEPGAVATGMDIVRHSIDEVAQRDPGIRARRRGAAALALECKQCPLLQVCGGDYYPWRFKQLHRKIRPNDPEQVFENAFRNPSAYCETQKMLISHAVTRLEGMYDTPPGTILNLSGLHEPVSLPSYPAPNGYDITIARRGDEAAMTEVHMHAFVEDYTYEGRKVDANPTHRRTTEHLGAFVKDSVPNVGFYDRMMTHWGSLTEGNQPDDTKNQLTLVARDRVTGKIVGIGSAAKQLQLRDAYLVESVRLPQQHAYPHGLVDTVAHLDHISALYVDPEYQGRKIGSALLTALVKHLGSMKIGVTVTQDAPTIEFFEKHGFKVMPRWPVGAPLWPLHRQGILLQQVAMFCSDFEEATHSAKVATDTESPAYV